MLSPDISEKKYHAAFSAYGATKLLDSLDDKTFSGGITVPSNQLQGIRQTSVVLLRLYTSLVYMRSEHLERGLDTVPDQWELNAFKQMYRSGCQKKNEDTLPQHMRNALCHGGVEFLDSGSVRFMDKAFDISINTHQVNELCRNVWRFYSLAYQVSNGLPPNPGPAGLTK